jgi:hypothetical protein
MPLPSRHCEQKWRFERPSQGVFSNEPVLKVRRSAGGTVQKFVVLHTFQSSRMLVELSAGVSSKNFFWKLD